MLRNPSNVRAGRDRALEALRGLASLSVVAWHTTLGFFPERSGLYPNPDPSKPFIGRVWFGLIYGTAAVAFFFVLSGFVLTRRYLLSGDESQIHRNAIKRWPRLVLPVFVTVLLSWFAFHFDLYRHRVAAVVTQSWWLYYFGNASQQPIEPNFLYALRLGTYLTFLHGDSLYDTSLWTMRYEFIGSFVAMGLALLVRPARGRMLKVYLIALAVATCHFIDPQYGAFPIGVGLAAFLPDARWIRSRALIAAMVLFGVYLLGYAGVGVGAFRPIAWVLHSGVAPAYVNVTGATLLIVAAEASTEFHSILSARWLVFLGRLSFPLYLVHVPVICSVGSAVLLAAAAHAGPLSARFIAIGATVVTAFALAYLLTLLNEWWLARLNRVVGAMMRSPEVVSAE